MDYFQDWDHVKHMLPDEELSPEQIAILKGMPGEKRLKIAGQLYWMARKIKREGLRTQHPDWSEEQLEKEVTRIFLYARS